MTGKNGDFYIDISTWTIYGPKANGVWPAGIRLGGGGGGSGVLSGTGPPGAGTGSDGDFYIDTAGPTLYGPKSGGVWPAGVSMVGADGTDGKSVLSGSGAPGSGTGVNGDFYIDTVAFAIYGPKASGSWPAGVSLVGANGTDGRTVLNGSGAPGAGTGADGDFYIDTASSTIYGPKAGGSWPVGVSLIGPSGSDGNTMLYGAGAPGGGTGVDGNFYIDTTGPTLYGPKSGGVWPTGVSMVGPAGPSGDDIGARKYLSATYGHLPIGHAGFATQGASTASICFWLPYYFPEPVVVAEIQQQCNTANALATMRLGLYEDSGNLTPTTLIADYGSISGATTGLKTVTGSSAVQGWVWVAQATSSHASVRWNRPASISGPGPLGYATHGASAFVMGWRADGIDYTAGLPSSAPTLDALLSNITSTPSPYLVVTSP